MMIENLIEFENELKEQGMQEGMQQGIEKGIQQGRLEGKLEGKLELVKNMYKEGLDIKIISKISKLSQKEIKKIISSKE